MRSPNFGPRRNGLRPHLVVLHYTAMSSAEAALRALCDPAREVSAHYLITEQGEVLDLVDEEMRAWHAGIGTWAGADDVNSRSIGIEIANDGASPFAAPAMDALEALLPGILERWAIPPEGVIGHSDMAPRRKFDPGPKFDWRRLARAGLSVWPEAKAAAAEPASFFGHARAFGYPEDDADLILGAFRSRFRPGAKGPVSAADAAPMADLARRYGVDRHGSYP